MKGIPPEIDSLLWAVAENPSFEASDEFVKRYPQYAGELARRRTLVKGLKQTKPDRVSRVSPPPTFRPRTQKAPAPRWAVAVSGAIVLAALAVGSYTLTTMFTTKPVAKQTTRNASPPRDIPRPVNPVASAPQPPTNANPPAVPLEEPPSETALRPTPGYVSLNVQGADLEASLVLLGEEAKVSVVVAPGMKKTLIDAHYDNQPIETILRDLGSKYGFSAFDQGDGSIIIVPAVPKDSVPSGDTKPGLPELPENPAARDSVGTPSDGMP